jgi:hypothetical protein
MHKQDLDLPTGETKMKFDVEKHILFLPLPYTKKTEIFEVWNTLENCRIGNIRWLNAWRHYVFYPEVYTVFSDRCLYRIADFVKQLNASHDSIRRSTMSGENK